MMDHPIPEGCGGDFARFGIVDVEMDVLARLVGLLGKFILKLEEMICQLMLKISGRGLSPFMLRRFTIGQQQI